MRRGLKHARLVQGLSLAAIAVAIVTPAADGQIAERLSRADLKTLEAAFADVADDVMPSVVAIRTYEGMHPYSQGSGVIIRSNGYILTNYHVLEEAPRIVVILHDSTEHDAAVMQVDERSDLAVVKIEATGLRAAHFGDLSEVRIGHWTFAVGNPFGISNFTGSTSFTIGNVSSVGRDLSDQLNEYGTEERYYGNLIETSAAINPGNSGGPLFNIKGEVIGIVSAIETRSGVNEGVGFAIPISGRTRAIIDRLIEGEEVRYGFLGVEIDNRFRENRRSARADHWRGAQIHRVTKGGPAARAGLRNGDVIIEMDGVTIKDADHLIRVIGGVLPGEHVSLRFERGDKKRTTTAILDDRKLAMAPVDDEDGAPIHTLGWRGAVLAEIPADLREKYESSEAVGLVVVTVRKGSDADKRGLQRDQIIKSVNGERVWTLEQFSAARNLGTGAIMLQLDNDDVVRFPRG